MHAYIISGSEAYQKQKTSELITGWKINSFDIHTLSLSGEHIGVADVRAFQKQMLLAPLASPAKAGIIEAAQQLTVEAQNALLKLLEEPPPNTYIVCQTATRDALLPTIVSRCEVIRQPDAAPANQSGVSQTVRTLCSETIGRTFASVDSVATDRTVAKQWTEEAISATRALMLSGASDGRADVAYYWARVLRSLLTARRNLEANVNPKLVLDVAFLRLKTISGGARG